MSRSTESPARRRRRKAHGGPRRLTVSPELQVHAAIPEGSRRAHNQPEALRAFEARIALEADLGRLRSDAEKNALLIARALVFSASWETLVARPGWDTLIDRCGRSRSTIAKYLALFNEWGLLGRVRAGSTRRTRGHKQGDEDGNLAGEYVLCVPQLEHATEPVEETRTPSPLRKEERSTACGIGSRTRAREADLATWPIHRTPETRGEQRQAAHRLRQQLPLLARIRTKRLIGLLAPWFELGWNPAQIRYALDHAPDGQPHWHTNDVRHVAGWLNYRLELWRSHTPARQLGAGRATDLEAADVATLPRAAAGPVVDAEAHASRARQLLAATKRRSDKPARRGLGVLLPGLDSEMTFTAATEPVAQTPSAAGDSDWLLRNAARRAEPDLLAGLGGLGAIA